MKSSLKNVIKIATGAAAGYGFFWLVSHPTSKLKKKIPVKNFKNFHFLPNIRYKHKDKIYHFHHWVILVSIYLPILISGKNILKFKALHGFMIGSIIQGLSFSDRFSVVYKETS